MNFKRIIKKRRFIVGGVGALLIVMVITECTYRKSDRVPISTAAQALKHITVTDATLVTARILASNSLREVAVMPVVLPTWRVARCNLVIRDGPQVTVLIDHQQLPVKVILDQRGRRQEYTVHQNKLSGKAATWIGDPLKLFLTEVYEDNKRNGITTYFTDQGRVICSCVFRDGEAWSGRTLHRRSFTGLDWDVCFKNGKLDGEERHYAEGMLERLRTFKEGKLDGLQQSFYNGSLSYEERYEGGVCRMHKSYHDNGQLEWETYYSAKGELHGRRCKWDEVGELQIEQNYDNGEPHGRHWERGHPEGWYWYGKGCGGKVGFEEKQARRD